VRAPSASPGRTVTEKASADALARPLLTVVVPVYNGGDEVVANIEVIRAAVAAGLPGEEIEVIVVSDGSIDGSAERLIETRSEGIRVIHYDRNLGKGYAVKAGALASHGRWIGLVDADLDLDPSSLAEYLRLAEREQLDFAIGSKRHPDSVVQYPRSRRIASWCYQQLNRVLFRLDVRDTQVGLKLFSRRVVDEVVPLLLVKRFAFDVELLAVAKALGYDRIRELPVRLEFRFQGSALRSSSVVRALWDTAAIFYRLRILRTYQRKRGLVGLRVKPVEPLPLVSVIGDSGTLEGLDYDRLELVEAHDRGNAARGASGELLGVLRPGARPASNWIAAAVPFFADPSVAAVVSPTVAPLRASTRERAAAAVLESRLGGGSRRSRYLPGNIRNVSDYSAESVVVRRMDYLAALDGAVDDERLVAWLSERGRRTVYAPDTSVSEVPLPVFLPHLRGTLRHARARGEAARRSRGGSLSTATMLSFLPAACAVLGIALVLGASGIAWQIGLGLVSAYAALVVLSALLSAVRFRSASTGLLSVPALVATQAAYVAGFLRGLVGGR
jgi:glycosyltransferase involved in cell wall biosynthesis